jgi:hypothetical protein
VGISSIFVLSITCFYNQGHRALQIYPDPPLTFPLSSPSSLSGSLNTISQYEVSPGELSERTIDITFLFYLHFIGDILVHFMDSLRVILEDKNENKGPSFTGEALATWRLTVLSRNKNNPSTFPGAESYSQVSMGFL